MIALTLAIALLADPTGASSLTRATLRAEPAPAPAPVLQSVAVTVECTAFADGRVGDCAVLGETHPGMGFGAAAITLMQGAQVDPAATDHQFARTIQFMP